MAENPRREAGNNKANETAVARVNEQGAPDSSKLCAIDGSGQVAHATDGSGQVAHATANACDDCADELDVTAEFPVLVLDDARYASDEDDDRADAPRANTEPTPVERPSVEVRPSFWLQHLESDVQRLQAKWESAAADLRSREAKVQDLCCHVETRDGLVDDLRRQIGEQANGQLALETDLKQVNARINDLLAAQTARDIVAGVQPHQEGEASLTSDLRAKVEELATYIDGSRRRWAALQEKLAEYRNAHRASERRAADAQARFMAATMSRDKLWTEAADLRRCLQDLGAQLAERETAHRELERSLKDERVASQRLLSDVADATSRGDQALGELSAREQRVAELEVLVLARDETIAGLEQRLRARDRAEGELVANKNDLEAHAAALELEVRLAVDACSQKERDCRNAQQRVTRFEGLLREASHEIDDLFTAIEEQERTIFSLEADLRSRQITADIFGHSSHRLDDIDIDTGAERHATVDAPPRRH